MIPLLAAQYEKFNYDFFGSKLPHARVRVAPLEPGVEGLATVRQGDVIVTLVPEILSRPRYRDDVLLHECVHVGNWYLHGRSIEPHDDGFAWECSRIMKLRGFDKTCPTPHRWPVCCRPFGYFIGDELAQGAA